MRNRLTFGLAALLLAAASASALAPYTVSYQGRLEDSGGNPVTDVVALQFTIYNDAVLGGAANIKWTETHPTVSVTDGLFNVTLGSVTPIHDSVFNQANRWLGIKVDLDPELTPRTPFTSVAYSQRIHTVDGSKGGTIQGDIFVSDAVVAGDIFGPGVIETYAPAIGGTGVRLFENNGAPRTWVFGEDGNLATQTDADIDGSGGFFRVYSGGGSGNAVTIDGNADGSFSPVVTIDGSVAVITFAPDTVGNTSVQLPVSAISATEILDEPGLAHNNTNLVFLPTGTISDIASRTITCPTSGYILAIASAEISVSHTTGTISFGYFGVSNASGSAPSNQDVEIVIPSAAPSGAYDYPFTSHGVFSVSTGIQTFYFVGFESTGAYTLNDINLTLLFFPTSYGVVSAPVPPAPGENDDNVNPLSQVAARGPLTQAEIDSEKREAEAFDRARVQAELDDMQVQIDRLRAKLRATESAQTPTAATK